MKFNIGDQVVKEGGDYRFTGLVVAVFLKRSGAIRVVVENDDGIVHVFNETQLQLVKLSLDNR